MFANYKFRRRTVWDEQSIWPNVYSVPHFCGPKLNPFKCTLTGCARHHLEFNGNSNDKSKPKKNSFTYIVLIFFSPSNVPLAKVSMLLSYNDNRFKFVSGWNNSLLIHCKEFAFSNRSCSWLSSLNRYTGN